MQTIIDDDTLKKQEIVRFKTSLRLTRQSLKERGFVLLVLMLVVYLNLKSLSETGGSYLDYSVAVILLLMGYMTRRFYSQYQNDYKKVKQQRDDLIEELEVSMMAVTKK